MGQVSPLPTHGAAFFDERDHGRSLRVSFHADEGVFVLSTWRYDACLSTFRLPVGTAPELVTAIVEALAEAYAPGVERTESA